MILVLVGLVTLTEMKAKQEDVVKLREKQLAKKNAESRLKEQIKADKKRKDKMKVGFQCLKLGIVNAYFNTLLILGYFPNSQIMTRMCRVVLFVTLPS